MWGARLVRMTCPCCPACNSRAPGWSKPCFFSLKFFWRLYPKDSSGLCSRQVAKKKDVRWIRALFNV